MGAWSQAVRFIASFHWNGAASSFKTPSAVEFRDPNFRLSFFKNNPYLSILVERSNKGRWNSSPTIYHQGGGLLWAGVAVAALLCWLIVVPEPVDLNKHGFVVLPLVLLSDHTWPIPQVIFIPSQHGDQIHSTPGINRHFCMVAQPADSPCSPYVGFKWYQRPSARPEFHPAGVFCLEVCFLWFYL